MLEKEKTDREAQIRKLKLPHYQSTVYSELKLSQLLSEEINQLKSEILHLKEVIQTHEYEK